MYWKPRYTNLEYLNRKSRYQVSVIKDKWQKIKQEIIKDEEIN